MIDARIPRWQKFSIHWKICLPFIIVLFLYGVNVGGVFIIAFYQRNLSQIQSMGLVFNGVTFTMSLTLTIIALNRIKNYLIRPITQVSTDSQKIARGDLGKSVTVRNTDDEVGQLTKSIKEMKDQLTGSLEEARKYQHAVEQAGLPIFITDQDGFIDYVNPAFSSVTGYSADKAVGQTPRMLISSENEVDTYHELWDTISGGDVWKGTITNQRKNGELFTVDQTIAPIHTTDGTDLGFVGVFRDITTRERNRQYREVLERVLRHNLRNELTIMGGYTSVLREEVQDSGREMTLLKLEDSIQRLNGLVSRSGDISTLLNQSPTEESLTEILETTRAHCPDEYPEPRIELEIQSAEEVVVDARVGPAVVELCKNAVVHNDQSRPTVTVRTETETAREGWVNVSVADTGPGIPDQEREVMARGEESPLKHGSGLGLWLVYLAVTSVGGSLRISDNEPRGTIVTLSIPVLGRSDSKNKRNGLDGEKDS